METKKYTDVIQLVSKWYNDGLQLAKWSDSGSRLLKTAFYELRSLISGSLNAYCMNVKGRGGVKGAAGIIHRINDYLLKYIFYPGLGRDIYPQMTAAV